MSLFRTIFSPYSHFFPQLFALYFNKHSKGLLITLFSKIVKCRLFFLRSISYVHMCIEHMCVSLILVTLANVSCGQASLIVIVSTRTTIYVFHTNLMTHRINFEFVLNDLIFAPNHSFSTPNNSFFAPKSSDLAQK